jgi:sugar diacid utilization regulator
MRAIAFLARPDESSPVPMSKLEEVVAAEALIRDPRSHAVTLDGMVVALTGDYEFTEEDGIASALLHRAKTALLIGTLTAGVGRPYLGVSGLRRTYREAAWSARAAELLEMENRVMAFRDLGIYGMLEPFISDPSTADTEDVEKLVEYDRQNHTALLPTLEAFFDAGASGDAAASLFVHRNTVSYRLRAVKRVTGLDVRDPDQRLLLEVQIRLARIRGLLPARSQESTRRRSRRGRK